MNEKHIIDANHALLTGVTPAQARKSVRSWEGLSTKERATNIL